MKTYEIVKAITDMILDDAMKARSYTVFAQRTPQHSVITIQFNNRPNVGDKLWYRGMELTVVGVILNNF